MSGATAAARGGLVALALLVSASQALSAGRAVTFAAADGTALAGQLYEAAAKPAPGVVLVHMLSRTKADWDDVAQQLESVGITALAIDLRGHGASAGTAATLPDLVQDVRAAVQWLSARPGVRPDAIALAGASLGANLALLAAADPPLRGVAAISPSLDYRGVRVGPDVLRKLGDTPVWLAASSEDPFAARTVRDLMADGAGNREQRLSSAAAHGTNLLVADPGLARALVDWLRQRLLS